MGSATRKKHARSPARPRLPQFPRLCRVAAVQDQLRAALGLSPAGKGCAEPGIDPGARRIPRPGLAGLARACHA